MKNEILLLSDKHAERDTYPVSSVEQMASRKTLEVSLAECDSKFGRVKTAAQYLIDQPLSL